MQTCRKKLHTQKGAAIFYALLLLLFAAMISAVVIAAALTMAQRVTSDKETEQARMTVRCAADYICDDLKEYSYTIHEITSKQINGTAEDKQLYYVSSAASSAIRFAPLMNEAIRYVTENYGSTYERDFTVTLQVVEIETVNVHFVMTMKEELNGSATYRAYFTLTQEGDAPYRIYMTMQNTVTSTGGGVNLASYPDYSVGGVSYHPTSGEAQTFKWSTLDISTQMRTEGWDTL